MLNTLTLKVRPEHCAVLLVDVQNDFCAEGGAMHREGNDLSLVQSMIPRLERFVEEARDAGVRCVWIKNVYNTGANFYLSEVWLEQAARKRNGLYVKHPVCEAGEWNGDFYKIRPHADEAIVIKHRFGAFESTDLDLVLRSQGIRSGDHDRDRDQCVRGDDGTAGVPARLLCGVHERLHRDLLAARPRRDAGKHRSFLRPGCGIGRNHGVLAAGSRQVACSDIEIVISGLEPANQRPLPFPPPQAGEGKVGKDARVEPAHDRPPPPPATPAPA